MKQIEDNMTPFGFIDDGINNEPSSYVDDNGTVWTTVDDKDDWLA
jgi:hypothetical protein